MLRLGLLIALAFWTIDTPTTAHAQVFKPKSSAKKSSDAKPKAAAKKSKKKTSAKKSKKKTRAKSEVQDEAESAPKESDKDFVKITDDDEIE